MHQPPQPRARRDSATPVRVLRVRDGRLDPRDDLVATEEPLEVRVVATGRDGRRHAHSVSVTMRTPGHDEDLAAGFLFTEGILRDRSDVLRVGRRLDPDVDVPPLRLRTDPAPDEEANTVNVELRPGAPFDPASLGRNFYLTSSCGVCGKASLDALRFNAPYGIVPGRPAVRPATLGGLPDRLKEVQSVFRQTGGLHAAALFSPVGELLTVREDVGRHNALDKLVGHEFLEGALPLSDRALLLSGRASWELMQKALMAGVAVVAAVGAPSSLAVDLAREFGITLVGFTRRDSLNIYAGEDRVAG